MNKNVPELRFTGFDREWEENTFNELFQFLPTNSFSRADLNFESGKIKNIHYGDIHTKFPTHLDFKKAEVPFINENINLNKIKAESYCKNGDLVIADASEDYKDIGKAIELNNINDERVLAGLHTLLARDKSGLTQEGYRGYILLNNNVKTQIKKMTTGISVLGISKTNLAKVKINLPSKSEQIKIASFLSKVDEKIEKLEEKQQLWETYKKGIMQQIFNQKLRFKDENGEEYPKWKCIMLKEVGKVVTGNTPSTKEKENFDNGNYLWVTPTDINDFKYVNQTERSLTEKGMKKGRFIPKNSVLVTCIASIGKNCILRENGSCNQQINAIIPVKGFDNEFIYYLIEKNSGKLRKYAGITATPILNKKSFQNMKFEFPTKDEQTKIANFLSAIDKKIEEVNKELKLNTEFKKGLLQKMFC